MEAGCDNEQGADRIVICKRFLLRGQTNIMSAGDKRRHIQGKEKCKVVFSIKNVLASRKLRKFNLGG